MMPAPNSITNAMILADAYRNGSSGYQAAVPDPEQSTLAETTEFLWNPKNKRWLNEFTDYLYNVFGATWTRTRTYRSPFAAFKRPWSFGDKSLEYNLHFLQAHAFKDDWSATDVHNLLRVYRADGESVIHEQNFAETIPVSYNASELRRGFDTETGLFEYMAAALALPYNTAELNELYRVMNLIAQWEIFHGFYKHQLSAAPTTKATGEEFAVAVQTIAGDLRFPSNKYNAQDAMTPTWINPEDQASELYLLATASTLANINVLTLGNLFHDERAEIRYSTIVIPELWIPNGVALLISRDWLVMWDQYYESEGFYNPQNRTYTAFLQRAGCVDASPFAPAILFTTASGTVLPEFVQAVTGFSLTVLGGDNAAAKAGSTVQLEASLIGTVTADPATADAAEYGAETVVPQSSATFVVYANNGDADDPQPVELSIQTRVDRFNVLHIENGLADGTVLTIVGKSTYTNPDGSTPAGLTGTVTITIDSSIE